MPETATGVFDLRTPLRILKEMGFFDVVLPFLLVFSVVYGVLESIDLFEKKEINSTIAFTMGILAAGSVMFTKTLKAFTPVIGIILFFLLAFIVVIGMIAGPETQEMMEKNWFRAPIILISVGVLLFELGVTLNVWEGFSGISGIFSSALVPLLVLSGLFIALIFIIGREEE